MAVTSSGVVGKTLAEHEPGPTAASHTLVHVSVVAATYHTGTGVGVFEALAPPEMVAELEGELLLVGVPLLVGLRLMVGEGVGEGLAPGESDGVGLLEGTTQRHMSRHAL